jgi:hypothetical protein
MIAFLSFCYVHEMGSSHMKYNMIIKYEPCNINFPADVATPLGNLPTTLCSYSKTSFPAAQIMCMLLYSKSVLFLYIYILNEGNKET